MAHYLQYWKPLRAHRAFDNLAEPIYFLENGWFSRLSPGDVLWLLTLGEDAAPRLILRAEIEFVEERRDHPPYAVGNSTIFNNRRATVTEGDGVMPYAVPLPLTELRKLRFHGRSERIQEPLSLALQGALASLRKLKTETIHVLEARWSTRDSHPWMDVDLVGAINSGFASQEHRRKVEKRAVNLVREHLIGKGWDVKSVEAERCGYDLHCTRAKESLLVEVKGTAGVECRFFLTAGELNAAQAHENYRLYHVSNVLTQPRMRSIVGKRIVETFDLTPIAFVVNPK